MPEDRTPAVTRERAIADVERALAVLHEVDTQPQLVPCRFTRDLRAAVSIRDIARVWCEHTPYWQVGPMVVVGAWIEARARVAEVAGLTDEVAENRLLSTVRRCQMPGVQGIRASRWGSNP
jgi:hypothetical protein